MNLNVVLKTAKTWFVIIPDKEKIRPQNWLIKCKNAPDRKGFFLPWAVASMESHCDLQLQPSYSHIVHAALGLHAHTQTYTTIF